MNQFPPAAAAAPVVCRPATVEIGKVIMEMTKFGRRYIVVCAGGKERRRKKTRGRFERGDKKRETSEVSPIPAVRREWPKKNKTSKRGGGGGGDGGREKM